MPDNPSEDEMPLPTWRQAGPERYCLIDHTTNTILATVRTGTGISLSCWYAYFGDSESPISVFSSQSHTDAQDLAELFVLIPTIPSH